MVKYLLIFILISNLTFCQVSLIKDVTILCSKKVVPSFDTLNNKKKMETDYKLNRFNPIYGTLKLSMLFYQRVISPQLSSDCVFEQSCSNYSKSAIKHCGIIKGILLTADRLTRCIPATENETEVYLFNEHGNIVDSPKFYSLKKAKK